ncbi:PfkB family carbohydrate kinase [Nocardia testacea]|uniref:PfkB family carbohydrate kinase n=1 Tax=Nocardia testacea TaxID=248551 RepID=UPI003C301400
MRSGLFVGLSTVDIAYRVKSYPAEDSKTQALDQYAGAGGPATNAAVAYAALGGAPTLLTAVGSHRLADLIRGDLSTHGVDVADVLPESGHTPPVSSIVVSDSTSTRTVVSLDGSRITADFQQSMFDHLDGVDVVLVDGHYPQLAISLCEEAAQREVPVVLDAGRWKDAHSDLLPFVHTAICSAAFNPPGTSPGDMDAVFAFVQSAGVGNVAVTNGANPIVGLAGTRRFEIAVPATNAVDTLGAGDILHGAYCFFASDASSFESSLTRASRVASFSCRYFGTREWCSHINEVHE